MKLSLNYAGQIVFGGALGVTLLFGLFALLLREPPPPPPPVYSVKVGVLENRKPSPNSRVWAIPESAESQLSITLELRTEQIKRQQDTFTHLIKMRVFYKDLYKHKSSVELSDSSLEALYRIYDGKLAIELAKLNTEMNSLIEDVSTSHKKFLDTLATMLDLIENTNANTNMEGTVTLSKLKEPKVVLYVLPAVPEQFTYSRKAVNLATDKETIVELQKLPNIFENP